MNAIPKSIRLRTWDVLELGIRPVDQIELHCPHCAEPAFMPIEATESPVIASVGLGLIFDNPSYRPGASPLPITVKCRRCRHVFTRKGT